MITQPPHLLTLCDICVIKYRFFCDRGGITIHASAPRIQLPDRIFTLSQTLLPSTQKEENRSAHVHDKRKSTNCIFLKILFNTRNTR